jgi:regulator of replication initiation timing
VAIRRRRTPTNQGLDELVSQTADMVGQLLRENRTLKAENQKLSRELERISRGWEEIRRLARSAPRSTSRGRSSR